ncbi:MAG TPA: VWA domain-containing protein [Pyrinomonadaceae bacterium]
MKSLVAFLLVLATFTSGAVGQRQNPPRSQKATPATPRNATIRICQGVPIPDGYVIVAYMTSTTCPHGAYILKKQDQYESSLAVNRNSAAPNDSGVATTPSGNRSKSGTGPKNSSAKSTGNRQPRGSSGTSQTTQPANNSASSARTVGSSAGNVASIRRPRRVSIEEAQEPVGPPTLIGGETARASGPPKLRNIGDVPEPSSQPAATGPSAEPTPEEVDEGDVVRVDTTLVTVPVSVLDRQGRFIPNLKREDFTLLENGEEQSIAYFEPAEKPFTVALLLDTSASTQFRLSDIKEAAIAFAKQLRPQDRVLVVTFNSEVLLLTEPTNDLNLMAATIEEFANTGTSTRLYDAIDLTIKERLNRIKGRKAIVLFTDGVNTESQQATYESTLSEIDELDALIYPIQYDTSDYMRAMQNANNGTVTVTTTTRGIFGSRTTTQTYNAPVNGGTPIPGSTKADYDRADQYLHLLADKTGGRLYQANDTTQLADAFTRIAEELRRQYTLGYYPKSANVADGERRQIRVRVRQPNLAVKARDSYVKSSPSQNK